VEGQKRGGKRRRRNRWSKVEEADEEIKNKTQLIHLAYLHLSESQCSTGKIV
jgi:hypothetical protein